MASHRAEELGAAAGVVASAVRAAELQPAELGFSDDEFDDRVADGEPEALEVPTAAEAPARPGPRIFDVEVSDRLAA
jgi:hypothetical protein